MGGLYGRGGGTVVPVAKKGVGADGGLPFVGIICPFTGI